MTAAATEKPDVNEMRVIHRVFRRELGALPGLVRGVAPGDEARAAVVGQHAAFILTALNVHHTGEDEYLWPLLLERTQPSAELVATMQEQHERVHEGVEQSEDLLASWRGAPDTAVGEQLATTLEGLNAALFEHLDQEEAQILPLVEDHVSVEEWARLGEHGRDSTPQELMPLMFGAIIEEANDAERDKMLDLLPPPAKAFMTTDGAEIYAQYIGQVRGG